MTAAQRRRLEQRRPPIAAMPHNGQPERALRSCELREIGRRVRTGESGPVPAELNMTALHAIVAQDAGRGEWRTVGCAVGVAMALIPKAVRERYRGTAQRRDSRPCIYEIIGRTLDMDPVTAGSLLFGLGSGRETAG